MKVNIEVVKVVGAVVAKVTSTLVLGEMLGGVISRPITAWKLGKTNGCDPKTVGFKFSELEKRIENLEKNE